MSQITAPILIAGPRAGGRDFGILARSADMPLREGQIEQIALINHTMIEQVGRFPLAHFFVRIDGGSGHWFLGLCRAQPPIAGNTVAITGGIVLHEDQLEQIDWRADLLVDPRYDPLPVFRAWQDPATRITRVDPITLADLGAPRAAAADQFDLAEVAPAIAAAAKATVVVDPAIAYTDQGSARALGLIGAALAAAPFERARALRWATAPLTGALKWDLATANSLPGDDAIGIELQPGGIELGGLSQSQWQDECDWLDLLDRADRHFGAASEVAAMLDDHRAQPTLTKRLVACLRLIHDRDPGSYDDWFISLLGDLCAALPGASRAPFHEAALELPVPAMATIYADLARGAQARLRLAGHSAASLARLAKPAEDPLALAALLTDAELNEFEVGADELATSTADCATRLGLAIHRGADDPLFAPLLHSAARRPEAEIIAPDQANWLLKAIPILASDPGRGDEDRLRFQLDGENLFARASSRRKDSDKLSRECQRSRLAVPELIRPDAVSGLLIRDFVYAAVRQNSSVDRR